MNLVHDAWIPVINEEQKSKLVSLKELYQQGETLRDLAVNPPQRIALMRLLICITQVALDGPEDENAWLDCQPEIAPRSLEYLEKHQDCFELYGEKAFLQVVDLAPIDNATLDKLYFGLASGNNPKLFDHEACKEGRNWSDGWRALMLLTYQCFSPGGLIGVTDWNGVSTPKTSEHAICIEESAVHTLILRENLIKTVHFNLITKNNVRSLPNESWGKPIWEVFHGYPDENTIVNITQSYLGRLIPLSRAVLLKKGVSILTMADGIRYPKLPAIRDTTTAVIIKRRNNQEVYGNLSIDLAKHPWRDLVSLLSLKKSHMEGGAVALKHLLECECEQVVIWTGGLAADKGKLLDAAEWAFSLNTDILYDSALNIYQNGINLALNAQASLGFSISSYCKQLKMENKLSVKARSRYWSELDNKYTVLISLSTNSDMSLNQDWYPLVRKAMEDAYAYACPHVTPRQIQAYALGRNKLRLKKFEEGGSSP